MPLELSIATGSSLPIYKQITDQVCMAIATGQLAPGDPLPSVRAVAERLVVNPNTVARAYADLARDGRVVAQPGRGLSVAPRRQVLSEEERARRLDAALDEFVRAVAFLDFGPSEVLRLLEERLGAMAGSRLAPSNGGAGVHPPAPNSGGAGGEGPPNPTPPELGAGGRSSQEEHK